MIKTPGEQMRGSDVELMVSHQPGGDEMDAYERLLGDAMQGDATLFAREDSVEAAWRIVDPVLGQMVPVQIYEPNTWGPSSSIAPADGWHDPVVA
jgi:glucose-6-phosphate 1-dehydrogenase